MKINRSTTYYLIVSFALVLLALTTFFTYEKNILQTFSGKVMGTTYKVTLSGLEQTDLHQKIYKVFNSVDKEMSTYIPSSSLSKLNRTSVNEWVKVSSEFIKVVLSSQEICFFSKGAFDISVGNLVNLYGFGPYELNVPLDTSKILSYEEEIGCKSFEVDVKNNQIRRVKNVYLDMSGIAKGFAIDLLSEYFDSMSINSYLIELGGEIRFKGNKSSYKPWLIGIEHPESINKSILTLSSKDYKNIALATSGEYRNFKEIEGEIVSHTIDPKTSKPLIAEHSSVSVIADNAMEADALATALNVMGFKSGLEFANNNHVKVLYLFKKNDIYTFKTSKWF